MYVRIITYSIQPSVSLEQARAVYAELLELLRHQPGYQGLSFMINEAAHQAVTLSYWSDEQSAAAAGGESLPLLMARTQELVDQPPEISGFDLVDQDPAFEALGHS